MQQSRELDALIPSLAVSDGAGVKLRRSIGARPEWRVDPFLMLDEFFSDDPGDYLAGFPSHPHRGFETVTIMLDGRMQHQDHLGNRGDLGPGDVQWMTAARGIIHSEMPQQDKGRMRGFQLWINLPARDKLAAADWRDVPAATMPWQTLSSGAAVRVIAGELQVEQGLLRGPVSGNALTAPLLLDLRLPAGRTVSIPVAASHTVFLYPYDGALTVGAQQRALARQTGGVLLAGNGEGPVELRASPTEETRVLLIAGRPLGEPIAQYGPFVMNTAEEIEQALSDYRQGRLTG